MKTLKDQAAEILEGRRKEDEKTTNIVLRKLSARKLELLKEFEIGFAEIIPQLENENIIFTVHFQDDRYEHQGVYIQFDYHDKKLKMDFSARDSYRYEYVPYDSGTGQSVYGKWHMEDFIIFLVKGLQL